RKFVGIVFVWKTFQLSPLLSTAYRAFSFLSWTYLATLASGSLKMNSVTRPRSLYSLSMSWKNDSSLSQPEQPQVRRTSTGPLAVRSARLISLPLWSLILNSGAGCPTSNFFLAGSSARTGSNAIDSTRTVGSRYFIDFPPEDGGAPDRSSPVHGGM